MGLQYQEMLGPARETVRFGRRGGRPGGSRPPGRWSLRRRYETSLTGESCRWDWQHVGCPRRCARVACWDARLCRFDGDETLREPERRLRTPTPRRWAGVSHLTDAER